MKQQLIRCISALLLLLSFSIHALEPTPGIAVIDGQVNEWNLLSDSNAKLCEAGNVDFDTNTCTNNKAHLATAYFRYDCNSETAFFLIQMTPGNPPDVNDEAWIKIYNFGNSPVVDANDDNGGIATGTPPEFSWTPAGVPDADVTGYEASVALEPGNYDIEVHINSNGRTASSGRPGALPLRVNCEPGGPDPEPAISVEKTTNGIDADAQGSGPELHAGDEVIWSYLVTNTGNVPLDNIVLTDDIEGAISCPASSLDVAEEMTCLHFGVAGESDYRNRADVIATYNGEPVQDVSDADPSGYLVINDPAPIPSIDIEKSTNGLDADVPTGPGVLVGDAVTWEYVVTNTGETALANIQVSDNQGVVVSCPFNTLAVAVSMTCAGAGTATEGQYANIGSVTGDYLVGGELISTVDDNDPSHYFGVRPELNVEKHTQGHDADSAPGPAILTGGIVYWSVYVTNTGNVDLEDIIVTDDTLLAPLDCAATGTNTIALLPVAETVVCQATGIAEDIEHMNTATACGDFESSTINVTVCDDDPSHYTGVNPGIDVEKATNGEDADLPFGPFVFEGGAVSWTYRVSNVGDVALTGIVLNDDQLGDISCPATTLDVGAHMDCVYDAGIAVLGQYANLAKVTGEFSVVVCTDPQTCETVNGEVMDTDPSHYYGFIHNQPSLEVYGLSFDVETDGELSFINGHFTIENASGGPEVTAIGIEATSVLIESRTRATRGRGWTEHSLFGNCTFDPDIPHVFEGATGDSMVMHFSCTTMTPDDTGAITSLRLTACVDSIFNRLDRAFCTKTSVSGWGDDEEPVAAESRGPRGGNVESLSTSGGSGSFGILTVLAVFLLGVWRCKRSA